MTSNITCASKNSSFTNFLKSYKCINNTTFIPLFKCEKSWSAFSFFLNFFFFFVLKSPKLPIYFLKSLLESQLLCHSVHNHHHQGIKLFISVPSADPPTLNLPSELGYLIDHWDCHPARILIVYCARTEGISQDFKIITLTLLTCLTYFPFSQVFFSVS